MDLFLFLNFLIGVYSKNIGRAAVSGLIKDFFGLAASRHSCSKLDIVFGLVLSSEIGGELKCGAIVCCR